MLPGLHDQNLALMMKRVVCLPRSLVSAFESEAYGAALTLVYLRAMPLSIRNNMHMQIMDRGGLWGGKNKHWPATELSARRTFYGQLNTLHQAAYSIASFDALTNADNPWPYQAEELVLNPWTLSDSEFMDGMVMLRHKKMPDLVGEEPDSDETTKRAVDGAVSVLKDEYLDFISEFLKDSVESLKPLLRSGTRFAARASIISALIETLADILEEKRVEMVKRLFETDEPRREFLANVGWGTYVKPGPMKFPTSPSYMPGLGRGSS